MSKTVELHHPLAKHHLAILRDQSTPPVLFRNQIRLLSMLLAVRATEDLSLTIAIIPILRAGLGLVEPILELIPNAEVWHLGMYRDEETAKPIEYYCKLPKDDPAQVGFVLDPMLATGGSIRVAVAALKRWGVQDVRVLSVIAAPEGIRALREEHPDVSIYVGAIDQELNDQKFIVPGLGDAGDRIFKTKR